MLCADELAVNAIQHSRSGLPGGQITVRVETQPGELYVEVADQGPLLRVVPDDPGEAAELAEHGRGLDLVRILASETGAGIGLQLVPDDLGRRAGLRPGAAARLPGPGEPGRCVLTARTCAWPRCPVAVRPDRLMCAPDGGGCPSRCVTRSGSTTGTGRQR